MYSHYRGAKQSLLLAGSYWAGIIVTFPGIVCTVLCRQTKFVLAASFREYVMELALYRAIQCSFLITQALHLTLQMFTLLASFKVQIQSTVLRTHCSSAFLESATNSQRQHVEVHCLGSKLYSTYSSTLMPFAKETVVPHFKTCWSVYR